MTEMRTPAEADQPMETREAPPSRAEQGESELVLALTTEANQERAETLASALLERGLVACVSLVPVVSHYRWEGQRMRSEEVQLLLKTRRPWLEDLYTAVMALHSYDTPEWITLSARTRGGYGLWCAQQMVGPEP
ncbi:MAG: divalent-cation tolerance protein CutA [Cyanobacteriota bacterium]|nr:divalent-cation tolerance protein CutA [Cyanobacteriota bacterium]